MVCLVLPDHQGKKTMVLPTELLLSHNHGVPESLAPGLNASAFATAFLPLGTRGWTVEPLDHHHWRVRLVADEAPSVMGQAALHCLRVLRLSQGIRADYGLLALGGRKDRRAVAGSPLQLGSWGVDVVETPSAEAFLATIGWSGLVATRPHGTWFALQSTLQEAS